MAALFYLSQIVKIWMLIDAYRRRPDPIWWFIIIFAPFGEWIYFFVVKRHDIDVPRMRHSLRLERPPTVKQLRAKLDYSASLANKTELAQGLAAAGEYDEAITLFHEVLARSEHDARARHGLGRALLEDGRPDEALLQLRRYVLAAPHDPAGYAALGEALELLGDGPGALTQRRLEALVAGV